MEKIMYKKSHYEEMLGKSTEEVRLAKFRQELDEAKEVRLAVFVMFLFGIFGTGFVLGALFGKWSGLL